VQERVLAVQLGQHVGEQVTLCGWLHHLRRLSSVSFLIVRDRSGMAQVVIEDPQLLAQVETYCHESVI
jgi:nondiscriminating aspartyl-tRNA synthetase